MLIHLLVVLAGIASLWGPAHGGANKAVINMLHEIGTLERKLYPNVDFYSGIIYQAMNIPSQMFTVLFAVARTVVGWIAQWKEMQEDPAQKISRPRQLYTSYAQRDCISFDKRK